MDLISRNDELSVYINQAQGELGHVTLPIVGVELVNRCLPE